VIARQPYRSVKVAMPARNGTMRLTVYNCVQLYVLILSQARISKSLAISLPNNLTFILEVKMVIVFLTGLCRRPATY